MTIEETPFTLTVSAVLVLIVAMAMWRYMPPWAWFVFSVVGFAAITGAVVYGATSPVALIFAALFALTAAHTWWRDLRGRPPDERSG